MDLDEYEEYLDSLSMDELIVEAKKMGIL